MAVDAPTELVAPKVVNDKVNVGTMSWDEIVKSDVLKGYMQRIGGELGGLKVDVSNEASKDAVETDEEKKIKEILSFLVANPSNITSKLLREVRDDHDKIVVESSDLDILFTGDKEYDGLIIILNFGEMGKCKVDLYNGKKSSISAIIDISSDVQNLINHVNSSNEIIEKVVRA